MAKADTKAIPRKRGAQNAHTAIVISDEQKKAKLKPTDAIIGQQGEGTSKDPKK
jgi:hypothetical protein